MIPSRVKAVWRNRGGTRWTAATVRSSKTMITSVDWINTCTYTHPAVQLNVQLIALIDHLTEKELAKNTQLQLTRLNSSNLVAILRPR